MKLSDFEIKEFYNYKIRSVVEDNTEIFFVTDLINQYNRNNNTSKRLKKYLEIKQTQDLLNKWNEMLVCQSTVHQKMFNSTWNI